jgi:hypothetical protein
VDNTPAFADQVGGFSGDLRQTLPPLLTDTALVNEPLVAYQNSSTR